MVGKYKNIPCVEDNIMGNISYEEVSCYIKKLVRNKAPGVDNITSEMLKIMNLKIIEELTFIFNLCIKIKDVLDQWKHTRIHLIYKSHSKYRPENYRSISLLCVQYKMLIGILAEKLSEYMEVNNFLSKNQLGYRREKDTIEGVSRLVSVLTKANKNNEKLYVIYVDFYKAYDSVEHWALED